MYYHTGAGCNLKKNQIQLAKVQKASIYYARQMHYNWDLGRPMHDLSAQYYAFDGGSLEYSRHDDTSSHAWNAFGWTVALHHGRKAEATQPEIKIL